MLFIPALKKELAMKTACLVLVNLAPIDDIASQPGEAAI
jgi:hypothetical protein